jgi:hypothetical protein
MLAPLRAAGGFLGGGFDLRNAGYRVGSINVRVAPIDSLPQPFRELDLQLDQPYALLTDGWNAAGPEHVHARAGGLVPTQRLTGVAALWRGLAAPLTLLEPSLNTLCLGLIEPDAVPEDRLERRIGPARRDVVCE